MDLPEEAKRAPSAPVWNQSFPSLRRICLKRLSELHLPWFGIKVFLLLRHCLSVAPFLSGATLLSILEGVPVSATWGHRWLPLCPSSPVALPLTPPLYFIYAFGCMKYPLMAFSLVWTLCYYWFTDNNSHWLNCRHFLVQYFNVSLSVFWHLTDNSCCVALPSLVHSGSAANDKIFLEIQTVWQTVQMLIIPRCCCLAGDSWIACWKLLLAFQY